MSDHFVITELECRALRDEALKACHMTEAEYAAYMIGKCHHKCWRPDGVPAYAWATVEAMKDFLSDPFLRGAKS